MGLDEIKRREATFFLPVVNRLPVALVEGRGWRVVDVDGREYVDLTAGWGVCSIGHCHPALVEAIRKQAGRLMQTTNLFYTLPQLDPAEALSAIAPEAVTPSFCTSSGFMAGSRPPGAGSPGGSATRLCGTDRAGETLRHAVRAAARDRITPGLPMPAFPGAQDIGPIGQPLPHARAHIRTQLRIPDHDALVLVAFGGIRLEVLPFDHMESIQGIQFLIDGPVPSSSRRIHSLAALSERFSTILSSVDVIMTKPGYGTTIETVGVQTPVVYVRRYNFADEPTLVDYLHRYGRGIELSREDFLNARWEPAIQQALALPKPAAPPPACTGAADAAMLLAARYLCQ